MNTMPMIRGFILAAAVGRLSVACSVEQGDCRSLGTCECRTGKECPEGKYCVDGRCQDLIGPAVLREFGEACAFDFDAVHNCGCEAGGFIVMFDQGLVERLYAVFLGKDHYTAAKACAGYLSAGDAGY